jgi:transcriptional regulator with GAF, ATPase, and Fis domain
MSVQDRTGVIAEGTQAILEQIAERLKQSPGYDLFTVLAPHESGNRLERLYSTNQEQYPLGPADEVKDDVWFRQLFRNQEPIVANTMEEISVWLPVDYQIFIEQNYYSLLNLPVVFAGQTIGLINMMGAAHHFDPETLHQIREEVPLAALAILGSISSPPPNIRLS